LELRVLLDELLMSLSEFGCVVFVFLAGQRLRSFSGQGFDLQRSFSKRVLVIVFVFVFKTEERQESIGDRRIIIQSRWKKVSSTTDEF